MRALVLRSLDVGDAPAALNMAFCDELFPSTPGTSVEIPQTCML